MSKILLYYSVQSYPTILHFKHSFPVQQCHYSILSQKLPYQQSFHVPQSHSHTAPLCPTILPSLPTQSYVIQTHTLSITFLPFPYQFHKTSFWLKTRNLLTHLIPKCHPITSPRTENILNILNINVSSEAVIIPERPLHFHFQIPPMFNLETHPFLIPTISITNPHPAQSKIHVISFDYTHQIHSPFHPHLNYYLIKYLSFPY